MRLIALSKGNNLPVESVCYTQLTCIHLTTCICTLGLPLSSFRRCYEHFTLLNHFKRQNFNYLLKPSPVFITSSAL